jgi:prepilin-type processing-associated H-X9-DG protein
MEENLVGYLLNSLDADTHREVEDYLRDNAPARQRLDLLRRALEPLAADAEPPEAPTGLWIRTLAHVAEDRCRRLPPAPKTTTVPTVSVGRSWWRRSDVLIAASVLLLAGLVSIPFLAQLRHKQQIEACKNNLHQFHTALASYSALHGSYPRVEADPPRNVAGIVVPVLNDARLLNKDVSVACPSKGRRAPAAYSVKELEDLHQSRPDAFREAARSLAGNYAYSLGYRDENGQLHGLRPSEEPRQPLMADCPPFGEEEYTWNGGNSSNHNGEGQNVLFTDGHVEYLKGRTLGANGDDIYLNNRTRRIEAGNGPRDAVLGPSWAHP